MIKILTPLILIIFSTTRPILAGDVVLGNDLSQGDLDYILNESKYQLPKLWNIINQITFDLDVDVYITHKKRLASTKGMHSIYLAPRIFTHILRDFPEDRLVVVLLHEYGHIDFNRKLNGRPRNMVDHEYAAFKYSLIQTSYMAEDGDAGPIRQLLHYLPLRMENGDMKGHYTKALRKLTKERFWLEQLAKYK